MGIPRIGWYNCFPGASGVLEGCALGDMIALAIRLTDAGVGDYWDDVDAITRNQLVESQLIDRDILQRISDASESYGPEHYTWPAYPEYPAQGIFEGVIDRSLGIFGSAMTPTSIPKTWVMQCCTANAAMGLYYAWEGIVREDGCHATVNMLMNRSSNLVDVESWLPYEGKAVVRNRKAKSVSVRIPGWVDTQQVRSFCDSHEIRPIWVGRYIHFASVRPGESLIIHFPVKEFSASHTVNAGTDKELTYRCSWRGSTITDISPRDEQETSYPLYQRDHMKSDTTPMRKASCFTAERIIRNW